MLNDNIDFDSRQVMYQEILLSKALTLGALAWRGYQLKGPGAVVVYGLKERKTSSEESIDAQIIYLSKQEAIQNYPEAIRLCELLDEYEPNNEMVVSFIHTEGRWIDSYQLTLEIPLIKCFILEQEQLLSV
jgi:hypothetical protein